MLIFIGSGSTFAKNRTKRLGHHFQGQKVKVQGHQAALLTAVLARQAAAAVGVGTRWLWETAATLPSVRRRKAFRRPRGRRGAGTYRSGRPPTACCPQPAA